LGLDLQKQFNYQFFLSFAVAERRTFIIGAQEAYGMNSKSNNPNMFFLEFIEEHDEFD